MAYTFTSTDDIRRITMDAAAGNLTAVTIPRGVRTVTISSLDAAGTAGALGSLALTGTDGAAIGSHFVPLFAGLPMVRRLVESRLEGGSTVLYLASSINSGIMAVEVNSRSGA